MPGRSFSGGCSMKGPETFLSARSWWRARGDAGHHLTNVPPRGLVEGFGCGELATRKAANSSAGAAKRGASQSPAA
jgi:hypothetical protein